MKLTITVTDERGATTTTSSDIAASVSAPATASTNGQAAPVEVHDGGPVPDELLAMEAQVAAGLKQVPRIQR